MSFGRKAHGLLGLTVFGIALSMMSSCVEAEGMLYVTSAVTFDESGAPQDTTPDACADAVTSTAALMNVGFVLNTDGSPYLDRSKGIAGAYVCVLSKLKSRVDNGVETSNVLLYEYDVAVNGGSATTRAFTGFISAASADQNPQDTGGGISIPIYLIADVSGIAGGLDDGEATESVAGVKIYGRTTGGLEVETNEFFIPVIIYRVDELCRCEADETKGEFACQEGDPGCAT